MFNLIMIWSNIWSWTMSLGRKKTQFELMEEQLHSWFSSLPSFPVGAEPTSHVDHCNVLIIVIVAAMCLAAVIVACFLIAGVSKLKDEIEEIKAQLLQATQSISKLEAALEKSDNIASLHSQLEMTSPNRLLYTIPEDEDVTQPAVTSRDVTMFPDSNRILYTIPEDEDVTRPAVTSLDVTMLPDSSWEQGRTGLMYRALCEISRQPCNDDVTHCRQCEVYQGEVQRLLGLLKTANTEIEFLNDEAMILQEEYNNDNHNGNDNGSAPCSDSAQRRTNMFDDDQHQQYP